MELNLEQASWATRNLLYTLQQFGCLETVPEEKRGRLEKELARFVLGVRQQAREETKEDAAAAIGLFLAEERGRWMAMLAPSVQ